MKPFFYSLYVLLLVIVMIPKEKFYYAFESTLSQYHLFISNEDISNSLVYLEVNNGEVLLDNQKIAVIDHIRIIPLVLINKLTLSSITFSPLYRSLIPGKVDTLVLTYSLLHPLSVSIQGDGDFGHCDGNIDLLEQKVAITFDATAQLGRYPLLVSKLHQGEGGLIYEDTF